MVCKVVEESMKEEKQPKGRDHHQYHLKQKQCNKGKARKFKKSCFNGEEDGISSAILLIACIACTSSVR
jgi:hypothetical protein